MRQADHPPVQTPQTQSIHEQGTGVMNEDALLISGNLFGVFDGATSLDKTTFAHGETGGYLAATIAEEMFHSNDASLFELADKANTAILREMVSKGVDVKKKEHLWSTSAAVGRVEDGMFDWVQSGDSLILVIYEDHTHELLVQDFDHDLETLKLWKETAATRSGSILDELNVQIRKVRAGMNITYGVINGEETALDFLNHGSLNLTGVAHILMFTDGLFIPREDPEAESNFKELVSLYLAGGLEGVRDHVRSLEKTDPGCRKYPRFKSHDDIAAIALSFPASRLAA
ncbi:protein phosphatase 2C domain-containing protein [Desulfoluna sp.]|uniref:protein phosphatase 2C domain-containing protein n=1 Tax=Desulfoluna sp. TaxID=2045199 RepID=UPI0026337E48|nr:protein phosphatase 2C domain-containing protein [Desulfoluna sp.]